MLCVDLDLAQGEIFEMSEKSDVHVSPFYTCRCRTNYISCLHTLQRVSATTSGILVIVVDQGITNYYLKS